MSHDFFYAHEPAEVSVLGLRLRPLSVGHLILLHTVESAFISPQAVPVLNDLAIGTLICSQSYEEASASLRDPDLPKFLHEWPIRLSGCRKWSVRLGFKPKREIDFPSEIRIFVEYLSKHLKCPNHQWNPGDFRKNDVPEVQEVKIALMRDLHIPEAELLDRSWLLSRWDYLTLRAMRGEIQIYNGNELQAAKDLANQAAEAIAKRGGIG